jgi:hypothetical protein
MVFHDGTESAVFKAILRHLPNFTVGDHDELQEEHQVSAEIRVVYFHDSS